jgi:cold shock CspA family protein
MKTGRIKWFNDYQNYGYIILYDGTEVYFHRTGLSHLSPDGPIHPGSDVVFDLIQTHTGPEAHNIEILG